MNKEKALAIAYAIIALSGAKYKEIPARARCIAQDANGSWWWYTKKPALEPTGSSTQWVPFGGVESNVSKYGGLGLGGEPKDFTKEVYEL